MALKIDQREYIRKGGGHQRPHAFVGIFAGATIAASRRALILNPNLDQPRYFLAAALYHQGLMAQALSEMH